jgi:hypothetical protein
MDALEKFLGGGQAVAEPPKKSTNANSSDAQAKREQTALAMIKEELRINQEKAAKGDKDAQINVAALNREIARFEKKSPAASKAASAAPAVPVAAAAAPVAQAATSDPLEAFLSGKPVTAPSQAVSQPVNQAVSQPVSQTPQAESTTGTQEGTMGAYVPRRQPVGKVRQIIGNVLKKGFETRQELGERAAGAVDTLYEALPTAYGAVQQAIVRPFTTPEKAEELGKQAGQFIAPSQPLGKVLGITGKETYKQPLGGVTEPIAEQVNKMFNVLGMTPEQISEKTGIPAPDIRNMVIIGSAALPQAIKEVPPVVGKVAEAAKRTKVGQQLTEAAKELELVRPGQLSKAQAQAQFEAKKGTAGSAGAAAVESSSLKQAKANELLIPMGDDYTRAQLTRNPADVRYESDTAKHPVYGAPFQEKYAIQNEKLRRNLQAEVDNTAAEFVGLPSADFGKTVIAEPFQNYKNNRYQEVNDAYTAANQAGETAQPISYKNITDFIESETKNRPTKKAENSLYALVEEEIKANDPNKTGKISILQMEDIRKLINDEIDPQKKGSVRLGKKLKDNIDKATENAGGDFYKKARELNTKFNNDFEDIAVIRDLNRNKKGLSDRVVPYEQLADRLVFKGPGSDLKSALDTFEKMGPEGQKIIQELRGYTADKIMQEATKNVQLDVNNKPYVSTAALNKVISELEKNGKLEMLFGKKGAERYSTLKDVTKELQTVPKDTTNPSGTAASIAAMLVESGVQFGVSGFPAPLVTGAVILKNKLDAKKQLKKAEEYANPKNKISEMIK